MNVVVKIEGRDALPIWVLPFVTGWALSPDMLIYRLVKPYHDGTTPFPTAFNLDTNNTPSSIPSAQWYEINNLIEKLQNEVKGQPKTEWRKRSIEIIKPLKAYVWLDEFNNWFEWSPEIFTRHGKDEITDEPITEPIELCFNPIMNTEDTRYLKREYNSLPVSNAAANGVTKWRESITNGSPIDWDYWKGLSNITPIQAAKLIYGIDPIRWPDDRYAANKPYDAKYNGEKIDRELSQKIQGLEQELDNHSPKWSLVDLVGFLGKDDTPFGMWQAIEEQVINQAKFGKTETNADAVTVGKDDSADRQGDIETDWQNDTNLLKLEKQHKAILEVIKIKKFEPMRIPDGEQGTIENICRLDYPLLFDKESSFSTAWKKGRKLDLFKMANHASFAKRGKQ